MGRFVRYWRGGERRIQAWQCRRAFRRSAKPLASMDKTHVTLFFDYEGKWSQADQETNSRKGVEYILRTLEHSKLRATFNCVGRLIENERETLERIAHTGHEIASHTVGHTRVDGWSVTETIRDMEQFYGLMAPVAPRVVGFRSPHSKWHAKTLEGLLHAGTLWNTEYDPASFPYVIAQRGDRRLWRMPTTLDDWNFERYALAPEAMLKAWRNAVLLAVKERRYVSIGFHPWVLGKASSRLDAFSEFVDFLCARDHLFMATFGDVARLCESRMDTEGSK